MVACVPDNDSFRDDHAFSRTCGRARGIGNDFRNVILLYYCSLVTPCAVLLLCGESISLSCLPNCFTREEPPLRASGRTL